MKKTFIITLFLYSCFTHADVSTETKLLINKYYAIPEQVKEFDWSNESRAKQKLIGLLEQTLTTPEIDKWRQLIKTTSAHSSYFSLIFEEMTLLGEIEWLSILTLDSNTIKAIITRNKLSSYWQSENLATTTNFIAEHRIKNYTQTELDTIRKNTLVPEAIEYVVRSKVEVEIILSRTNDSLRIASIDESNILSSTLELILP